MVFFFANNIRSNWQKLQNHYIFQKRSISDYFLEIFDSFIINNSDKDQKLTFKRWIINFKFKIV